jgi:hypothetical protein
MGTEVLCSATSWSRHGSALFLHHACSPLPDKPEKEIQTEIQAIMRQAGGQHSSCEPQIGSAGASCGTGSVSWQNPDILLYSCTHVVRGRPL